MFIRLYIKNNRAELATEEYLPVEESVLENIVIVKKNPDYKEPKDAKKK